MRKAIFIFANRPLSLHLNMIDVLNSTGDYSTGLIYMNRIRSKVDMPLTGRALPAYCDSVSWPDGSWLGSKIFNRFGMIFLFVQKVLKADPDIVHAWNLEMLLCARITKCFRRNLRIVFTLQDTTEWMLKPAMKNLQRWLYRSVDQFMVTSKGFEKNFLREFGLIGDGVKVVYVPNAPRKNIATGFRKRQRDNDLVVGYIGAFKGEEGIATLVEGVSNARRRGVNVRVVFAGIGVERWLVQEYAEKYDFVTYLGSYSHDEIAGIYEKVDVLYAVYNRTYDKMIHMPYRLSEGVCFRLPIIALKGSHVAEIVERERIGIVLDIEDVDGLEKELVKLIRDGEKLEMMAKNCGNIADDHVFESYTARIVGAYEAVS